MSQEETQLEIIHHFDSGLCPPYEVQGNILTFQSHPINVYLRNHRQGIMGSTSHPFRRDGAALELTET